MNRPIASIVRSLGKLSSRWLKKDYPYRRQAVRRLAGKSGFSESMAEAMLDAIFRELTAAKLNALLRAELKDPRVLDGFRREKERRVFARGPREILHIFSANIPNAAILSFVLGMLVKSRNIGRLSRRDPGFLDIYLSSLKAADPKLWKMNRLLPSGDRKALEDCLRRAELVVAYGSDESLDEIRRGVPAATPFFGYGHRFSAGLYYKEALTLSLAAKAAHDVWMCGQRGCLSPTTLYVQKGGKMTPQAFAAALAEEMRRLRFRCGILFRSDENGLAPAPGAVSPVVSVKGFSDERKVFSALRPFSKHLQCIALECPASRRESVAAKLAALNVNRVCRAGTMQQPPSAWHHDGKPNLAYWLIWTDLEDGI